MTSEQTRAVALLAGNGTNLVLFAQFWANALRSDTFDLLASVVTTTVSLIGVAASYAWLVWPTRRQYEVIGAITFLGLCCFVIGYFVGFSL